MQNAKSLHKMREDAEPAKVQNEAEWTVPGYRPGRTLAGHESISYESSYLPFLYPTQEHAEDAMPRSTTGRRIFKHGKENPGLNDADVEDAQETDAEQTRTDDGASQSASPEGLLKHAKPVHGDAPKPVTRTLAVADNAAHPSLPTGFLRPGGVDAPPTGNGRKLGSVAAALYNKKPKREAEESSPTQSQFRKKLKKED